MLNKITKIVYGVMSVLFAMFVLTMSIMLFYVWFVDNDFDRENFFALATLIFIQYEVMKIKSNVTKIGKKKEENSKKES